MEEKASRTILLHKGGEKRAVGNWRQITIGNILHRIYTKVWDTSLRNNIQLNERQKAFIPVEVTFENVAILQHAIQSRRNSKKELNLVFLDLAKAFAQFFMCQLVRLSRGRGFRRRLLG